MFGKTKKTASRIASLILSAALFIPTMYGMTVKDFVRADDVTKSRTNTKLGVSTISDPRIPTSGDDPWQGSYVYFGNYRGMDLKFRVLNRNTQYYGDRSMLLDCDTVLWDEYVAEAFTPTDWFSSSFREHLNTTFLNNYFTKAEQDSILSSNDSYTASYSGFLGFSYQNPVGLDNDKIFVLNATDILNGGFGYYNDTGWTKVGSEWDTSTMQSHPVPNHCKTMWAGEDNYSFWVLRNSASWGGGGSGLGAVDNDGYLSYAMSYSIFSPAMNIKYDSILFSTAVSGLYGELGTEYKLTILDPDIHLYIPYGTTTRSGNRVSFSYWSEYGIADPAASDLEYTYLITKNPYGSEYNSILDYGYVTITQRQEEAGPYGRGEFILPSNLSGSWGEDYFVYVLAEFINEEDETDYACKPVEVLMPQHPQSYNGKNSGNTQFGTSGIHDPRVPVNKDQAWWGSYVSFGEYNNEPIKFRVLSSSRDAVSGENVMFLDSDGIFDFSSESFFEQEHTNMWLESDARDYLNGTFFNEAFSSVERGAVPTTAKTGGTTYDSTTWLGYWYSESVGLNDKVFVLGADDILTSQYGYFNDVGWRKAGSDWGTDCVKYDVQNQMKQYRTSAGGGFTGWRLRDYNVESNQVGIIGRWGGFDNSHRGFPCIAPALNILSDSVLFSTATNGNYGELGTEYKLTFKDPGINLAVNSVVYMGNKVGVNYSLTGADASNVTQLSYVITKTKDGAEQIAYYGPVDIKGSVSSASQGSFVMPSDLSGVWGKDYKVYFVAEDINGVYESDYASETVEADNSKMALIFEMSNGDIILNPTQREAINNLRIEGSITVRLMNGSSENIDVDKNGTADFVMKKVGKDWCLKRLVTCSFLGSYQVTQSTYLGVLFRVDSGTTPRPKIAGHQLRLSDEINVKYKVEIPDGVDMQNSYMEFKLSDGRTQNIPLQSAQVDPAGGNSRIFAININALELDETISATLHFGSGEEIVNVYSVMNYIETIKDPDNSYQERERVLAGALQDYGYYMQRQTAWTDGSEHNGISEPANILTTADVADAKTGLSAFNLTKDLGTSGLNSKVKVSMALNEKTVLKILVKPEGDSVITSPNAVETVINGETYYQFSSPGIGPQDLGTDYEFVIETTTGTARISVCPMYYVKQLMNNSSLTEDQSLALTAYYKYWVAAKNY